MHNFKMYIHNFMLSYVRTYVCIVCMHTYYISMRTHLYVILYYLICVQELVFVHISCSL